MRRLFALLLACVATLTLIGCAGNTGTHLSGRYVRTGGGESVLLCQSGEDHAHVFLLAADEETQAELDKLSTGQTVKLEAVHIYERDGILFTEVFDVDRPLLGGKKEPDQACLAELEGEEERFLAALEQLEGVPRTEWTVSDLW